EPVEKFPKMEVRQIDALGGGWCYSEQRFDLAANSVNRLVVTPGAKEDPPKPQKIEVVNLPPCATCRPNAGTPDDCAKNAASTNDGGAGQNADAKLENP